jgi:signal transduction histidine kinase
MKYKQEATSKPSLASAIASPPARPAHSLRLQLLLGAVLIIILTSAASGLFVTYSITERFESIVARPGGTGTGSGYPSYCDPNRICLILDDGISEQVKREFISSATNTAILVLVSAGIITLVLLSILVMPRLQVIEDLTIAARHLANGQWEHRVKVRASDEISELARSFNAMGESLQRLENLRRIMVSDIAHELRTPLSNIQGYMEGLRDEVIPPTTEIFESLHQEAALLTRLVNDLQTLALADAGQIELRRVFTSLNAIVKNVVIGMKDSPHRADQPTINVKPLDHLPRVSVDPDRLKQVVSNLLANALAHTPPTGRITIEGSNDDKFVWLTIRDTGSGIAPEHLPYVFERFYRADKSRNRATGGTGIGLAIVKQLVQAHGGIVEAKSEVGVGSCFRFSIPIEGSTPA